MHTAVPLACFLSMIRPPGVQFESALLQIAPVDKTKCPLVRDTNDIQFQLFTRYNPTVYQELVVDDDEKLMASHINFHDKTVIYFHAFMEIPDGGSGVAVREAYMLRGDTNVIMVDASRLEAGPWYFTAADNTWYIGRFAAKFIDYLVSRGLDLSKTHLVGHSLGAQSAGVAGGSLTTGRVSRITGLDPALPLFANLPLEQRLDPSDAHFVDVIHTDAGIFGVKTPTGHADFYPNGGISPQPGCELEVVIPQQLLLNKCNSRTHPQGYYTFDLKSKKHGKKRTKKNHKLRKTHLKSNVGSTFQHIKKTDSTFHDIKKKVSTFDDIKRKDSTFQHVVTKSAFHDIKTKDSAKRKMSTKTDLHQTISDIRTRKITSVPIHVKTKKASTFHGIKSTSDTDLKATLISVITPVTTSENTESIATHIKTKSEDPTFHSIKTEPSQSTFAQLQSRKPDTNPARYVPTFQGIKMKNLDSFQNIKTPTDLYSTFPDINTDTATSHVKKRQKRFLPFLKKSETAESDNFFFRILEFLNKNRKNVIPVFTVMREINTLVKSANGELNHSSKERNNYIGHNPPITPLVTYNLELGSDSKVKAFVKRLLGLKVEGDRLTIAGK